MFQGIAERSSAIQKYMFFVLSGKIHHKPFCLPWYVHITIFQIFITDQPWKRGLCLQKREGVNHRFIRFRKYLFCRSLSIAGCWRPLPSMRQIEKWLRCYRGGGSGVHRVGRHLGLMHTRPHELYCPPNTLQVQLFKNSLLEQARSGKFIKSSEWPL